MATTKLSAKIMMTGGLLELMLPDAELERFRAEYDIWLLHPTPEANFRVNDEYKAILVRFDSVVSYEITLKKRAVTAS